MTLLLAALACSKPETAPVASSPTTDTAPVVDTEPITCRPCRVEGGFLEATVEDEGDLSAVEGCIRLGSLTVSGTELADLGALVCLEEVDSVLRIADNALLTNLDGLSALTSAGEIWIGNNTALADIGGLSSLERVRDFTMYGNSVTSVAALHRLTEIPYDLELLEEQLRTVDGLENLERVGATLALKGAALEDLSGFRSLRTIGERLLIYETEALTDLTGFSALEEIELHDPGDAYYQRSLHLLYNDALTSLRGLEGLTELRGDVYIGYNDALRDLTGLDNVVRIEGDLQLSSNAALYNLAGLESLTSVEELSIYGHGALTEIDALANLRDVGAGVFLDFNGSLTNVDGLTGLQHADILADSNGLQNLDGLINLQSGGLLWFYFNRDLSDISGLRNVREAEWIRLEHLKGYTTLDGVFPVLEHALLTVGECEGLTSLGTIPNLRSGGVSATHFDVQTLGSFPSFEEGSVSSHGPELTSIGDFPVLRKITILNVDDSPYFSDLSGLSAVEDVDELRLVETALTDIDELSAVKTYTDFNLSVNPRLTDISALSEVTLMTGLVVVGDNDRLCQDHVDEIFADIAVGTLSTGDNGTIGCDP